MLFRISGAGWVYCGHIRAIVQVRGSQLVFLTDGRHRAFSRAEDMDYRTTYGSFAVVCPD